MGVEPTYACEYWEVSLMKLRLNPLRNHTWMLCQIVSWTFSFASQKESTLSTILGDRHATWIR